MSVLDVSLRRRIAVVIRLDRDGESAWNGVGSLRVLVGFGARAEGQNQRVDFFHDIHGTCSVEGGVDVEEDEKIRARRCRKKSSSSTAIALLPNNVDDLGQNGIDSSILFALVGGSGCISLMHKSLTYTPAD